MSFHKQNRSQSYDILNFPLELKKEFDKQVFEEAIQSFNSNISCEIVPEGREIKGEIPASIAEAAKNIVSGLIPLADKYPMPFYRVEENAV